MSLSVENLVFGYTEKMLLNGISFTLEKGDSLCLLGPNGIGKTTLLRCLLGIMKYQAGFVRMNHQDIRKLPAKEVAKEIAYVPQATSIMFPYTVLDMVMMGRNPHIGYMSVPSKEDRRVAIESLELLGIVHLAEKLFGEISGGERQMALIARALTQQSNLLIMDEPTASLDYGNQVKILQIINQLVQAGYSIIMTSHFPNHAFLSSNKVALMKGGRILAMGDPKTIITEENLSALYGTKIKVVTAYLDDENAHEVHVCVPLIS